TLEDRVRVLGENAPDTLTSRNNLACAYQDAGDLAQAIPLHERTLEAMTRVLGENAPDTLTSRDNLARAYHQAGRASDAVALMRSVVEGRARVLGSGHPSTADSRVGLVVVLSDRSHSLLPGDTAGAWQDAAEAVQAVGPYLADNPGVYGPVLAQACRLAADILDTDGQSEAATEYRERALHAEETAAAANASQRAGDND
ncbi:tetratricopeptide repeat protein, partial [Kitasatospora sp. NPDC001574]